MEKQTVRVTLLLAGILATVAFGPLSAFGAYVLLVKWATAASLAVGLLVAAFTFTGVLRNPADLLSWLMLPTLAVGVFLLGATIGEVRSNGTIARDGKLPPF